MIGWENGVGAERPLDVRLQNVHEIAIQADWVAESWHGEWTNELLQSAGQLVWLDLPWRIAGWRILMRHMGASLAGTNKHRGLLKLYHFMLYARDYYTSTQTDENTRLTVAKELHPYQQKVVHCQRPADVEAFFSSLVAQKI